MGLCKCPKKKVTNQFCFEHRVNVCEHCMVTNHPKCVVQSYLQWLQDSDYNPICDICKTELANGECLRLVCYHVFHCQCLDNYANSLPPNTAPAGYTCPTCKTSLFPASNVISPVAEALRNTLSNVNWARPAFGLPLIDIPENNKPDSIPVTPNGKLNEHSSETSMQNDSHTVDLQMGSWSPMSTSDSVRSSTPSSQMDASFTQTPNVYSSVMSGPMTTTRKLYDATETFSLLNTSTDHDENKYKRRSAVEWLARWFKSRTTMRGRHDPNWKFKRCVIVAILVILTFFTVVMIFIRLGRAVADEDPFLDPLSNPQIKVGDR